MASRSIRLKTSLSLTTLRLAVVSSIRGRYCRLEKGTGIEVAEIADLVAVLAFIVVVIVAIENTFEVDCRVVVEIDKCCRCIKRICVEVDIVENSGLKIQQRIVDVVKNPPKLLFKLV